VLSLLVVIQFYKVVELGGAPSADVAVVIVVVVVLVVVIFCNH